MLLKIIKYSVFISLFFSLVNQSFSAGGLTHEDCNTGIYSSSYGSTCDTCGYFNDGIHRIYQGVPKAFWDYYINQDHVETVFSSSSYSRVIDFGLFLNEESIGDGPILSNWVPASLPEDEAIIFTISGLTMNNTPANRSTPVGRIEYMARGAAVNSSGETSLGFKEWKYLQGTESRNSDGTYVLTLDSYSSDGESTKNIYASTAFNHKQCYVLLPAWCGDGVIDSAYGETCDPADSTQRNWGDLGCSNSCRPVNDTGGGGGGGGSYCGDGNVQRPNSRGTYEECDFGSNSDWGFCNRSTCQIENLGGGGSGDDDGQITVPNDGALVLGPIDYVTVGDGMNPYEAYSLDEPYIYNNSDYDFYFEALCSAKYSGESIAGTTNQCRDIPSDRILRPGDTIRYSDLSPNTTYPNYRGYPDGITGSSTVGENILVTTVRDNGVVYSNAYFAAPLKVRVAKPTITTTGGGTSFVNDTTNISDVNDVAVGNKDENKNFVGAGVSSGDISSYSKDVTEEDKVDKVVQEGQDYNSNVTKDTDYSGYSLGTTDNISSFESYNGITNAFVLKDQNFEINTNVLAGLSGPRTYIIENGDLIINRDIDYSDNIAFVVKGGNIKIDKSVTNIDGIYITIPNGSIGGEFEGTGGKTFDLLVVDGSLYGNVEKLVSQRTYIKENSAGLIDVGTVVSFGSSVFRQPAPLTTTFINEFIEATKIAQ